MIWPMLVPLGIKAGVGERGDEMLVRLRAWMSVRRQAINSSVLEFYWRNSGGEGDWGALTSLGSCEGSLGAAT